MGGELRGIAALVQLLGAPAARGGGEGGAALVKALCGALRGLVAADDNKSRFTDAGGPAAVVDVMRMYLAVASLQEVALGCLAAAILRNPEGAIAAVEAGAASAAVALGRRPRRGVDAASPRWRPRRRGAWLESPQRCLWVAFRKPPPRRGAYRRLNRGGREPPRRGGVRTKRCRRYTRQALQFDHLKRSHTRLRRIVDA